jgi:hypothetical protein
MPIRYRQTINPINNQINLTIMRKYLYLAIAAICLGLSACGGDDEELAPVNTGEENTTDFAVTGSVQEVYLEEDDNRNYCCPVKVFESYKNQVGFLAWNPTLFCYLCFCNKTSITWAKIAILPDSRFIIRC